MQRSILAVLRKRRTANPAPSGHANRWKVSVLLLVLTGFGIWFLGERWRESGFHWSAFAGSFAHLRWGWIAGAAILIYWTYAVRAVRWRVMLAPLRPDSSMWGLFSATVVGFTAVVLLGRPGEFVRPYLIARKESVPLSSQLAAWFLERIWDLLAVILIFGFSLAQIGTSSVQLGTRFEWVLQTGGYVVAVIGLVCLFLLIMLGRFSEGMRKRLIEGLSFLPQQHHSRVDRIVTAFLEGAASTKRQSSLLLLLSYTILEWFLIVLCIACVFWAYPATSGFGARDVMIFTGFLAFGGLVQIPGIGGGVQIVTIVILNELFGIALETSTAIAIMIWIITFVAVVPIGLGLAFHEGLNWKQFKALEEEAVQKASRPEPGGEEA